MAVINAQGLVDDGSSNLTVGGSIVVGNNSNCAGTTTTGANLMSSVTLAGSGTVTIASSGFFQAQMTGSAGAGQFTGSLPSPVTWAGADLIVTDSTTVPIYPFLLTGTLAVAVVGAGGIQTLSSSNGTKLSITKGGSVVLASDTARWLVVGVNGVATLAP